VRVRVLPLFGIAVLALCLTTAALGSKPSPWAQAHVVRTEWLREVAKRAGEGPHARFGNLPRHVFLARLRRLHLRYGFRVVETWILRPVQDAPLVVVQTARDPKSFSRDVQAIQRSLDPKARTGDDRTGWAYEGFYLEVRDTHGTPFLAVFNYWRGPHVGGGQWASNPSLYPYGTLGIYRDGRR
jgi:hypothetical protein